MILIEGTYRQKFSIFKTKFFIGLAPDRGGRFIDHIRLFCLTNLCLRNNHETPLLTPLAHATMVIWNNTSTKPRPNTIKAQNKESIL